MGGLKRFLGRLGGNDKYGNYSAWGMSESPKSQQLEADKAAAAQAQAAIRQSEFEASTKMGLERLALRRKRGFAASMIADPLASLGSTSTLGS